MREQSGLLQPHGVDVQTVVGEVNDAATAVDHRSREQRWRDIHGHTAGGWRQRVARHAAGCRERETRRWDVLVVRQPALHAHVGRAPGKCANPIDGMRGGLAEQQRPVAPDRAAAAKHREIGMGFEAGEGAVQADCAGERTSEREVARSAAQAVERQRVRTHVGEDAEDRRARVERNDATDDTDRPVAVVVTQRPTEARVLERTGQRASGIELALQIEGRYEPPHRAEIDAPGFDYKRLEGQLVPRHVDLAFALDLCLGPSGEHGITERPSRFDLQRAHRPVDDRLAGEAARERQRVEIRARQLERQIARLQIPLSQRDQSRVGGTVGGNVPGKAAVAQCEIERTQLDFQHASAVRRQRHAAVQHRVLGKARVDEADVGQRG